MRILPVLIALVLGACPLLGDAVTNKSVIKMVEAGLGEDVIVMAIRQGEPEFELGPMDLVELKEKGVSDKVLKAMLASQSSGSVDKAAETKARAVVDKPASSSKKEKSKPVTIDLPAEITPEEGGEYYTRISFHYERGRHITTNYARGTVLPINTRVRLVSMGGDEIMLEAVDSGARIRIENVEDYSGENINGIAKRMLADKPTPIEKFDDGTEDAIRAGQLRLGMTKQQAILARGYPPAHATASTDADVWKYWSSRFVTRTIVFRDGVLAEGRGLH